jgi:hypothetical protein
VVFRHFEHLDAVFESDTCDNLRQGYAKRLTVEEPFQGVLTQVIRFGPLFLIGMFLYGSVDANDDLTRTNDPYLFTFKGEAAPKLEIFLRNFDKGALVRDAVSQRVEFRKWDEISSISTEVERHHNMDRAGNLLPCIDCRHSVLGLIIGSVQPKCRT